MTTGDVETELESLRVDGVNEILGVALSVLEDHAPDHGDTRIERLARFVLLNIMAHVTHEKCGNISRATSGSPSLFVVEQVGRVVGITSWPVWSGARSNSAIGLMSSTHARELATALILCADHADNPVEPPAETDADR